MLNKSDLFRRAWTLVRLNRGSSVHALTFSAALRMAWAELKAGDTWAWTAPDRLSEVRTSINALSAVPVLTKGQIRLWHALHDELGALLAARTATPALLLAAE